MAYDLIPRIDDSEHRLLFKIAAATSDVANPPDPDEPANQLLRRIAQATSDAAVVTPDATQAEMEAGTETEIRRMSPENIAQAIAALGGASGTASITGGTLAGITGLGLRDTSAAFDVTLGFTSSTALTAARTLTVDVINASRTVKLAGNVDLGGNFTTTGSGTIALGGFTLTVPATGTAALLGIAQTFTATQTITPAANTSALVLSGSSLTGSNASNGLDISATWNTSGNPSLIYGRVTNTASGATAKLLDLGTTAGGSLFSVNMSGNLTVTNVINSAGYLNIQVSGSTKFALGGSGVDFNVATYHTNFLSMDVISTPAAPSASKGRLYCASSGGKVRLMAIFPSGAAQLIATEP